MEKKLYGVLMAFGATEAAMNNGDSFENGKKIISKKTNFIKNDHISTENDPPMTRLAPQKTKMTIS